VKRITKRVGIVVRIRNIAAIGKGARLVQKSKLAQFTSPASLLYARRFAPRSALPIFPTYSNARHHPSPSQEATIAFPGTPGEPLVMVGATSQEKKRVNAKQAQILTARLMNLLNQSLRTLKFGFLLNSFKMK